MRRYGAMALCISSFLGRGALGLSRTAHWTTYRFLRAPTIPLVRAASSSRKSRTRLSAASSKGTAGKRSRRSGDAGKADDADAEAQALDSAAAAAPLPFADAYHTPVMLKECVDLLVWDPNGVYVDGTLGGGGHSLAICERLDELAAGNAPSEEAAVPADSSLKGPKSTGKCLSLDRDPEALATASRRLATHLASGRWACAAADFRTLEAVLRVNHSSGSSSSSSDSGGGGGVLGHLVPSDGLGVHGLLLDLGVSSHQLDDRKRGFSFRDDGPLDMRMGQQAVPSPEELRDWATSSGSSRTSRSDSEDCEKGNKDSNIDDASFGDLGDELSASSDDADSGSSSSSSLTAATIVNTWPVSALERVLRDYGEEPRAHKMALRITEARPINGTAHLVDLVRSCLPPGPPKEKRKALTRVFQGLRIAVNDEMAALEAVLEAAAKVVRPGGRIVVLSYHSLEDRRVKRILRSGTLDGVLKQDARGNSLSPWKLMRKVPKEPTASEVAANPRARSAKLRAAERTSQPPPP